MEFNNYQYLWPPRPDSKRAIAPSLLPIYEARGHVAQIKKNGTCSVIAISPDGEVIAMNRHNETHKLWSPTAKSSEPFSYLPGTGWFVFVAELLHSKVAGLRDTNYLFDILVADGDYLVGRTFAERQQILNDLFPNSIGETFSHRIITENLWVAKLIDKGLLGLFKSLEEAEDEGLVVKDPKSILDICSRQSANTMWQVKCRKPHKNFSF